MIWQPLFFFFVSSALSVKAFHCPLSPIQKPVIQPPLKMTEESVATISLTALTISSFFAISSGFYYRILKEEIRDSSAEIKTALDKLRDSIYKSRQLSDL